jgi:hypothetical protein
MGMLPREPGKSREQELIGIKTEVYGNGSD